VTDILSDDEIRALFIAAGFTVKDGHADLKPYVYAAARAVERAVVSRLAAMGGELPESTPMETTSWGGKEAAFRMNAYYYTFEATGVLAIDLILSAVACAGKAYHHTDSWSDPCSPYHERLRGETPIDWIKNAAKDAADQLRTERAKGVAAGIAAERARCIAVCEGLEEDSPAWILHPSYAEGWRDALGTAEQAISNPAPPKEAT
jgi:hypothetical protein